MSGIDSERPSRLPAYPLLDGHKRRRKKLVPILNDFAEVSFVNTLDAIVPEVLWIGGAIETLGLRSAIEVVSEFLKCLWSDKSAAPPEFFRLSVLSNPDYREKVCDAVGFEVLSDVFGVFAAFYGEEWSPQNANGLDAVEAAKAIDAWVKNYWNRFEQPFLLIGATIIYSLAVSDRMKFAPGTMPDINAIAESIESADGLRAASFVRASLLAFFPQSTDDRSSAWCRLFWSINYKYSDCQFDV